MDLSDVNEDFGGGSGIALPIKLLALCTISTLLSMIISLVGIRTHSRNYRIPLLQRFVAALEPRGITYHRYMIDKPGRYCNTTQCSRHITGNPRKYYYCTCTNCQGIVCFSHGGLRWTRQMFSFD